jgi:hypothetical protein
MDARVELQIWSEAIQIRLFYCYIALNFVIIIHKN